ncbi:aldehyde dehydrogenase [Pseudorhodoferax sp.]|uniref:aldehyde dehydrogenase n=1 Tax=Pseudorhodoferax sp. TaxID=1993553 RepID=UPI0039E3C877
MTPPPSAIPYGHHDRLYIGGAWVPPGSDGMLDVIAPATETCYVRVAEAREADIHAAVAAARAAFDHGPWPRMTPAERAGHLRALGQEITARAGDIAQVWPNEMGVVHALAQAMAARTCQFYGSYADLAGTYPWEARHTPAGGGDTGLLVKEPVGTVAAIIPWNSPISLLTHKLAPALLAGCTVVVKAAPEAPGAAYIVAEAAEAAGLPPGVVNVLTADRAASEALVRHPGIDKVAFTGSTAVGRRIGAILSERIGRCTLELGGKSAAIVFDDYDIDTAAKTIATPACMLSGQVCSSLTRIIVGKGRHDQMVEALAAHFGAMRVGDPFDPATQVGPLASRRQRERVEGLIAKARQEGAVLATGGKRPGHLERGFYIEPTVFGRVDNASTLAREEVFGPVLSVIAADSDAHAVALANDTLYGLNNSVFTHDVDRAYAAARQLRSGTVGHNVFRTDFSIGFGGFKQSGIGREGLVEGLDAYLESKTVILDGRPSREFKPNRPPGLS